MTLDQKRARVFGVLYLITFVTSILALPLTSPCSTIRRLHRRRRARQADPPRSAAGTAADHREHRHRGRDLPDRQTTERRTGTRLRDRAAGRMHVHPRRHRVCPRHRHAAERRRGAAEGTVAYTLAAIKDWTFLLGPGWVVGWGNGLILGYLMYRSGLVPRQTAWLGLIGGPLIIIVRDGSDVRRRPAAGAFAAGRRDDPGVPVGALPRPLLQIKGFRRHVSDPFSERAMTDRAVTSEARRHERG